MVRCKRGVPDRDHFELLHAPGRAQHHGVAFTRLDERARHRRDPADVAPRGVDLVDAHDADRAFLAARAAHRDGRAEEDLVRAVVFARRRGVHHFSEVEPPDQEADAPIDLAQALLAVNVIRVLRAIAIARGPRHGRYKLRALALHELIKLALQTREAARRHVVARAGRQRRDVVRSFFGLGALRFLLAESLAHWVDDFPGVARRRP